MAELMKVDVEVVKMIIEFLHENGVVLSVFIFLVVLKLLLMTGGK